MSHERIDGRELLHNERSDAGDASDEQGEAEAGVDDGDEGAEVGTEGVGGEKSEADLLDAVLLHGGEAEFCDEDDGGDDVEPGEENGDGGGEGASLDGGRGKAQHAGADGRADDEADGGPEALLAGVFNHPNLLMFVEGSAKREGWLFEGSWDER